MGRLVIGICLLVYLLYYLELPESEENKAGYKYQQPIKPLCRPYPKGVYKTHFKHYLKVDDIKRYHHNLDAKRRINIAHAYNAVK